MSDNYFECYCGKHLHESVECGECGCTIADAYSNKKFIVVEEDSGGKKGRVFESGAYRDCDESKLDYARALSSEVMKGYLHYLQKNRLQSNGEMRDFDNWKRGIPIEVYISSWFRHFFEVWEMIEPGLIREDFEGYMASIDIEQLKQSAFAAMFNNTGFLYEILHHFDSIKK